MSIFQRHQNKILVISTVLVLVLIISLPIFFERELEMLFAKTDVVKDFVLSFGIFAPVIFIFLQFAQVVLAPIPANIVVALGGFAFGWYGLLYGMIGAMFGYYVIFLLSRKFGRPLAEKFFDKKTLDKFDHFTKGRADIIIFVIFILPFFPDDIICYLAGLTKTSIRNLMIAAFLGRIPGFLLTNLIGMGLDINNVWLTAVATIISLLVCIICWWQREPIDKFIKKFTKKQ